LIKNSGCIPGQLVSIGKGGIAFVYIENGEQISDRFNIDVFSSSDTFCLKNMPLKVISDVQEGNEPPSNHENIRRCTGQFEELTHVQAAQLDYFLENYTDK
jgi:hypothetical protein